MEHYLYLSCLCFNTNCQLELENKLRKFSPRKISEETHKDSIKTTFIIGDISKIQNVIYDLDKIHMNYKKFRYLLLQEHGLPLEVKGQFRIHINKEGKKITTKCARKRIGLV